MKPRPFAVATRSVARAVLTLGNLLAAGTAMFPVTAAEVPPGSRILYETGFEPFEGFNAQNDLAGQNGWVGFASNLQGQSVGLGGNGLLTDAIEGFSGQTAYIGFNAPNPTADFNVWRPVNLAPVGGTLPVVQFTVTFQVEGSTTNYVPDSFRWSVYNLDAHRLFSIDLDNATREISAILDDGTATEGPLLRPSGFLFRNGEPFDLELLLNFQRNLWTAKINGVVVVNALPITTKNNVPLNLGDIDAVWLIREPGKPGDNYMIFDDYRVVATPLTEIPPTLETIGIVQPSGAFSVRVLGEPSVKYQLEVLDGGQWTPVASGTAQSPDGFVDLQDPTAKDWNDGMYRAVSIP